MKCLNLAVQPSLQSKLQVAGPILFNSSIKTDIFFRRKVIFQRDRLVKNDETLYDNDVVTSVINAMMYLYKEAKYAIFNIAVESVSHLGQASTLFGLLTLPDDSSTSSGLRRCWSKDTTDAVYRCGI